MGAGGGLGSIALQYAKAMGLEIIAIDGGDEKKAHATKLGAKTFVDFQTSKNVVEDVKAATEDGLGKQHPRLVFLFRVDPDIILSGEIGASRVVLQNSSEYDHPEWVWLPKMI